MPRPAIIVIACALITVSCGAEAVAPSRAGSNQAELGSLVAAEAVAEPLQLPEIAPPAPDLNPTVRSGPHPLTNRFIPEGELLFMLPNGDDLGDLAAEFILDDAYLETNTDVVRLAVQDRTDEAGDVAEFGRIGGGHAVFRPRLLLTGDGPLSRIDTWVSLFDSDEGASGYLDDYALDAAKGVGAGRATHQAVLGQSSFAIDPIGDESLAFTMDYSDPGTGGAHTESETLVVFRIGRLLVFTSVTHAAGGDYRLRTISLTEMVHERVLGVLRGTIRLPEPEAEPVPLQAYAFHFEQAVERGAVTAKVEADGVVVLPDALACDVTLTVGPSVTSHRYVVRADQAWFDYGDDDIDGFFETPLDSRGVAQDLLYCPGWAVELQVSGLDRAIKWAQPSLSDGEGSPAWTYRLGEPELVAAGVVPPNSGIAVDYFTISTSFDGPWLLDLGIDLTGPASAFTAAFGDEFGTAGRSTVKVRYRLTVTDVNDPALVVTAPEDQ